jgi:hypothetical protein
VALSITNVTTKIPRMNMAARGDSMVSKRVPTITPAAPETSSAPKRRTVAIGAPRRRNWIPSITMFGRISTTTAVFTSVTRLSSGVAREGNPKPIAPLTRPAAITTAAMIVGITVRA